MPKGGDGEHSCPTNVHMNEMEPKVRRSVATGKYQTSSYVLSMGIVFDDG